MTFDPRARARELSLQAAIQCEEKALEFAHPITVMSDIVESALGAFAREVLTQEPDEGMTNSAVRAHKANRHSPYVFTYEDIYRAMSAHRAKSLEDGA